MLKRFIKDIEAKIMPYTVLVMFIVAAISASFIVFYTESTKAAPIIGYETFDDDVEGDAPDSYWYTFNYVNKSADFSEVSTDQSISGSQSYKHVDIDTGTSEFSMVFFNLTEPRQISYFNISFYFNESEHNDMQFYLMNETGASVIRFVIPSLYDVTPQGVSIKLQNETEAWDSEIYVDKDCWTILNITFNWSTYRYRVVYINETGYKFYTNADGSHDMWETMISSDPIYSFKIQSKIETSKETYVYMDDLQVGNVIERDVSKLGIIADYLLYNERVNWSGLTNTIMYSNETGTLGKNVTIYADVNASENCTDIFIDVSGDLTFSCDSGIIDIDSSSGNATLHLQAGTDETWSNEWVQFTDANSYNISLNTSWDSLSDDTNPFTISNASGNVTIHCIFKLDLDESFATGLYNTTVVWEVSFKYDESW